MSTTSRAPLPPGGTNARRRARATALPSGSLCKLSAMPAPGAAFQIRAERSRRTEVAQIQRLTIHHISSFLLATPLICNFVELRYNIILGDESAHLLAQIVLVAIFCPNTAMPMPLCLA